MLWVGKVLGLDQRQKEVSFSVLFLHKERGLVYIKLNKSDYGVKGTILCVVYFHNMVFQLFSKVSPSSIVQ